MRVLHANLARGFRGGERQTLLLAEELRKQGIETSLLLTPGSGIPAHRTEPMPCLFARRNLPLRIVRGFDVVHAHEAKAVKWAWWNYQWTRTPYIITRRLPFAPSRSRITGAAYQKSAAVVCLSRYIHDAMADYSAALSRTIIPDMYTPGRVARQTVEELRRQYKDRYIIGHLGALVNENKGQEFLIEAARILGGKYPEMYFLLLGDGRDKDMLLDMARGLDNVEFAGFHDNVYDYLALFDLFAFPSLYEGLGSVLLDAMHCELPIVATGVTGIVDIIHHEQNGLLVPPANAEALARGIERLYRDRELAQTLAQTARREANNYSPPVVAERYIRIYKKALNPA